MLRLLPARTAPPTLPFARRHTPARIAHDYTVFRPCLRWEFGFTCAICLLHEGDVARGGSEGWGTMHVEHIEPRSANAELEGVYENLLYICRLCNMARSDSERIDGRGRRLLDPTFDVWSEHFRLDGDRIVPLPGDADAEYTEEVYALNAERKVKVRANRATAMRLLGKLLEDRLSRVYPERTRDLEELCDYLVAEGRVWEPGDAPTRCRCGREEACCLPRALEAQVINITIE